MDPKHKGANSELIACAWLQRQGYEVFRNVSCYGPMDIIATWGTDVVLRIDVKSATNNVAYSGSITAEQQALGVLLLYVFPDGTCYLDRRPPLKGQPRKPVIFYKNVPELTRAVTLEAVPPRMSPVGDGAASL